MTSITRTPVFVVAVAFVVFVSVAIVVQRKNSHVTMKLMNLKKSSTFGEVDFENYFGLNRNGYNSLPYFGDSRDAVVKYSILDNYNCVVEPHAAMDLMVLDTAKRSVFLSLVDTFTYDICTTDTKSKCYSGEYSVSDAEIVTSATVPCSSYDELTIVVKGYSKSKDEVVSSSGTALCLYVRREIRSLTKSDLEDTMGHGRRQRNKKIRRILSQC